MTRDIDKGQFRFVAVAVAVALVAHLNHLPAWLATGCTLVVGFALLNRSARLARLVAFIRLPLAGMLLLAVLVEYGNFFGRDPGTAFACGLLALKLLETRRVRDARAAIGFAAFVLMSALLFRQSLAFSALVGAGTVLSIDQNGSVGGAAFDDVVVLAGFTTSSTLDQLIDQDVILVS